MLLRWIKLSKCVLCRDKNLPPSGHKALRRLATWAPFPVGSVPLCCGTVWRVKLLSMSEPLSLLAPYLECALPQLPKADHFLLDLSPHGLAQEEAGTVSSPVRPGLPGHSWFVRFLLVLIVRKSLFPAYPLCPHKNIKYRRELLFLLFF